VNFGTPYISRERFKLETSNLAYRLLTGGPNEKKCKIGSKGAVKGSRDLLLEFWDPLHISGTVEATNFKFGMQIGHVGPKRRNAKLGQKGSIRGHVTYFSKFWDPINISGTVEARNLKFGMQIYHCGT